MTSPSILPAAAAVSLLTIAAALAWQAQAEPRATLSGRLTTTRDAGETEQQIVEVYHAQSAWRHGEIELDHRTMIGFRWRWNGFPWEPRSYRGPLPVSVRTNQQRLDQAVADEHSAPGYRKIFAVIDPDKDGVFQPVLQIRNAGEITTFARAGISGDRLVFWAHHDGARIELSEYDRTRHHVLGHWYARDAAGRMTRTPIRLSTIGGFCPMDGPPVSESVAARVRGEWHAITSQGDRFDLVLRVYSPDDPYAMFFSRAVGHLRADGADFGPMIGIVREGPREALDFDLSRFDGSDAATLTATVQQDGSLAGRLRHARSEPVTWTASRPGTPHPRP